MAWTSSAAGHAGFLKMNWDQNEQVRDYPFLLIHDYVYQERVQFSVQTQILQELFLWAFQTVRQPYHLINLIFMLAHVSFRNIATLPPQEMNLEDFTINGLNSFLLVNLEVYFSFIMN